MWLDDEISSKMIWVDAISYCENKEAGGYSDWRLPNARELMYITDISLYLPAVNSVFHNVPVSGGYWSSTTVIQEGIMAITAWVIDIESGQSGDSYKGDSWYAKCVRGGL
jgi:hypothetical protein